MTRSMLLLVVAAVAEIDAALDLTASSGEGGSMSDRDPKQVVRRLIEEVMNNGDPSALDELYAPDWYRRPGGGSNRFSTHSATYRCGSLNSWQRVRRWLAGSPVLAHTHLHVARPRSDRAALH
jgi:hypothetical protein